MHYDVFTSNADGNLNYEFVTDDTFSSGTYTVIIKQESGSDAALFGIGKYPNISYCSIDGENKFCS